MNSFKKVLLAAGAVISALPWVSAISDSFALVPGTPHILHSLMLTALNFITVIILLRVRWENKKQRMFLAKLSLFLVVLMFGTYWYIFSHYVISNTLFPLFPQSTLADEIERLGSRWAVALEYREGLATLLSTSETAIWWTRVVLWILTAAISVGLLCSSLLFSDYDNKPDISPDS